MLTDLRSSINHNVRHLLQAVPQSDHTISTTFMTYISKERFPAYRCFPIILPPSGLLDMGAGIKVKLSPELPGMILKGNGKLKV